MAKLDAVRRRAEQQNRNAVAVRGFEAGMRVDIDLDDRRAVPHRDRR